MNMWKMRVKKKLRKPAQVKSAALPEGSESSTIKSAASSDYKSAVSASKPMSSSVKKVKTPMPSVVKTYASDVEMEGKYKYDKSREENIVEKIGRVKSAILKTSDKIDTDKEVKEMRDNLEKNKSIIKKLK